MKILLSYSKYHFDPDLPKSKQKYWDSSANILARSLYGLLNEMGELTYVDAQSGSLDELNGGYDLFIGIHFRFMDWRRASRAKKSVFLAVNMHPKVRNELIRRHCADWNIPSNALASWDLVDPKPIEASIKAADYILCVGNIATYNSYIQQGVPKNKIKVINYGVGPVNYSAAKASVKKRYVFVASELGVRKGFDVLCDMIMNAHQAHPGKFHLDLVGSANNKFYERKIATLQKILGSDITSHGWVESHSSQYKRILARSDYLIFPSLEEGQTGTVLDALRVGVVPIISKNSGIDFSPLGWLETEPDRHSRAAIFDKSLSVSKEELYDLKSKALEYYKLFHEPYLQTMRENLKEIINEELYPKVSIILSIYNKEDSILRLLKHLDEAILEYKNVELNVIFDGCKDKSEKIVRRYLRNKNYAITYETTPNIFEVKSNNIGLKKSTGKYCCIVQDDNIIYDRNIFFEAVTFLDKATKIAILGGLAGVNYYPRGTKLEGPGQIALNENEAYWRQDENTDPDFKHEFFEVDACMRGPLFIRKSFLDEHGYLDEIYAPLYQDDMDIAFRAKSLGYKVFAVLMNVKNESYTIASYSPKRIKFFKDAMQRNTNIFYGRWNPTIKKNYLRMERIEISSLQKERRQDKLQGYFLATRATSENIFKLPRVITKKTVRVMHHPFLVGKKIKSLGK
ncbi:MAG: glycosyltransferase [Candidatus Saccharimonadales bacterium]|jgi:glycosyltransferase involved in cell wall biosynthesis